MKLDTVEKLRWFWRVIILRRDSEGICFCGRYKGHLEECLMNPVSRDPSYPLAEEYQRMNPGPHVHPQKGCVICELTEEPE